MRLPSVKTLMQICDERVTAKRVRSILEMNGRVRDTLRLCDEFIPHSYGVEHIERGHNAKSPAITYCNRGDPYWLTLMYVQGGGYRVGCWGDIVERGNYD